MTAVTVTDLNNAKVDVDHIAAIANSPLLLATDRLGNTKRTIAGIIEDGKMALSIDVFPDTATGLAATTNGKYFSVPSPDADEYLILYLNSTGAAVEQKRYLSAEGASKILAVLSSSTDTSMLASQVVNQDSGVIGGVASDGRVFQNTPKGLWPFRDAHASNPLGSDGTPTFDAIQQSYYTGTASPYRVPDDWQTTLYIIPFFGQSLAGGANDNVSDSIFNPTPTYPNQVYMPIIGNKPDMVYFDRLKAMYEYQGTGFDSNFETALTTTFNTLVADLLTLTGTQPKFASFMASRGSRTWAQIGPGNDAYTALMKGIAGCCRAARSMGLRPVVPSVIYLQGEQDRVVGMSRTDSERYRLNMQREINKSVKLMTGQVEDVVVFVSQPNNATAADGIIPGHMMAAMDVDGKQNIRVLPPHYPYTIPSNVHPDSASYVVMGGHISRAIREEVFGPGYYPLRVVSSRWNSPTEIDLTYSLKSGPLVIDTSGAVVSPPVWAGSLYGFQFFDNSGSPPSIFSASVISDPSLEVTAGRDMCILRIVLSTAPTGTSKRLHYATRNDGVGANSGNLTGARGCIRDSASPPIWANSEVIFL